MIKRLKIFIFVLILWALPQVCAAQKTQKVSEQYANGTRKSAGKYKGNEKTGLWVFFNEQGKLTAKERWKNGKFLWRLEYNEKQRPAKSINAKGEVKFFKGCGCKN